MQNAMFILRSLCLLMLGIILAAKITAQNLLIDNFYQLPLNSKFRFHGQLIKMQKIQTSIKNANAWKILYWSTTNNNTPVVVSGLVIASKTIISKKSPIISWAHGTTGIATNCAPSMVTNPVEDAKFYYYPDSMDAGYDYGIVALTEMINKGYVVVATDYNGLGIGNNHQYLIGETEARAVLDIAIAAKSMHELSVSNEVISIGWSQGGQAAIWSAQIANYAKSQIALIGAIGLAPVNIVEEMKVFDKMQQAGQPLRSVSHAEAIMADLAMTYAYPELKLEDVLTSEGIKYLTLAIKNQCNHHMADSLQYFEEHVAKLEKPKMQNEAKWQKRFVENALGTIQAQVPVAVYQGDQDVAVFPAATIAYVKDACKQNVAVDFKMYPGVDHIGLSKKATPDFLKWIEKRLQHQVINNCNSYKGI